jgi:hypothetical protein
VAVSIETLSTSECTFFVGHKSFHALHHCTHDEEILLCRGCDKESESGVLEEGVNDEPGVSQHRRPPQFVRRPSPSLIRHPDFPHLPEVAPMTYTLAMKACLSQNPEERPSFVQLLTILRDLKAEVAAGSYLNSEGAQVVCFAPKTSHFFSASSISTIFSVLCFAIHGNTSSLPFVACRVVRLDFHCTRNSA